MALTKNKMVALDTHDVAITTATISIKTIQVNNRQLTQSIFKQLPQFDLVDRYSETPDLCGLPWGYVNYHWGDIDPRARHFVIQRGTTLYRSPFIVRDFKSFRRPDPEYDGGVAVLDRWNKALRELLTAKRKAEDPGLRLSYGPHGSNGKSRNIAVEGVPFSFDVEYPFDLKNYEKHLRSMIELAQSGDLTVADIQARIDAISRLVVNYGVLWDSLMCRLRSVEQLYISA